MSVLGFAVGVIIATLIGIFYQLEAIRKHLAASRSALKEASDV